MRPLRWSAPQFYLALILVTALVRLLFLAVKPYDAVSFDVGSWEKVIAILARGGNPYAETTFLNWPSPWMIILFVLGRTAEWTELPFRSLLFLLLTALECVLACATFSLLRQFASVTASFWYAVVGVSLSPVLMFLAGQHGNFDVIPTILIALFLRALTLSFERSSATWWLAACALLGAAVSAKTFPLILAPLLLAGITRRHERHVLLLGLLLVLGPVTMSVATLFVLAPEAIATNVLQYRSLPHPFGLSYVFTSYGGTRRALHTVGFGLVVVATWAWLAALLRRPAAPTAEQVLLAGALLLILPAVFGPGFGTQYLLWPWPALVAAYPALRPAHRRWMLAAYGAVTLAYVWLYSYNSFYGALLTTLAGGGPATTHTMFLPSLSVVFVCYCVVFTCLLRELLLTTSARAAMPD